MDYLTETVLETETIYEGRLVRLYRATVRLPNGETSIREIVRHPGAVAMVPLTPQGEVILVQQFRLPSGQIMLEIPAGTLKPGEDPLPAAHRELQEEIGLRPGRLTPLGGEFTAPGYTSEFIHLFLAEDLEPAPLAVDDDEFLETVTLPLDEALQRVESGAIQDGKTITALLLVARRLGR
ncbi:MAG: NUDIX hydrolase [Anaerolineae bacterium]|nr:NUDIX hydrolase [Anaerolineae bacterium]